MKPAVNTAVCAEHSTSLTVPRLICRVAGKKKARPLCASRADGWLLSQLWLSQRRVIATPVQRRVHRNVRTRTPILDRLMISIRPPAAMSPSLNFAHWLRQRRSTYARSMFVLSVIGLVSGSRSSTLRDKSTHQVLGKSLISCNKTISPKIRITILNKMPRQLENG